MSVSLSVFLVWAAAIPWVGFPETEPPAGKTAGGIAEHYREAAQKIIEAALESDKAYRKLEYLCLRIGPRLSGSSELTQAIHWTFEQLRDGGADNARREKVTVPYWLRGPESATMTSPRNVPLAMLGLGGSIQTPREGIRAHVVVADDWSDLEWLGRERIQGRIVLFNHKMPPYDPQRGSGYGEAVEYRVHGASRAAEWGAVAVLVRSVTANSMHTPHTGALRYDPNKPKIPAAAVSVEDAEMITRLLAAEVPVMVELKMTCNTLKDTASANVIGELRGSTKPEEVVVIGGHLDSWDVGQGAHDDGGGCIIAMETIALLRKLNLIPKRTIRAVLWTNEENGLAGARAYAEDHKDELSRHVAAIESDGGVFRPTGFSVECQDAECERLAAEQVKEILTLLEPLGSMEVETGWSGADVSPMRPYGVVLMGHRVEGSKYFDYHHSHADTIDKVDPKELAMNVAALATMAYVLADMPERIGRPAAVESGSK